MGVPVLEFRQVSKGFGGLMALYDLNFSLMEAEILGLIGPNGAGKTTAINLASGLIKPQSGQIFLAGEDITDLPPWRIASLGLARSFQHLEILEDFSVLENVMVGLHRRGQAGFLAALFRLPRAAREEKKLREEALAVLEALGLKSLAFKIAGTLPYGLQRQVVLARAWASRPQVILLDEPAAGLNAAEKRQLIHNIRHIQSAGCAVLLVEHDMALVMEVCERLLVLNHGRLIAQGPPREIQRHPEVVKAYLG